MAGPLHRRGAASPLLPTPPLARDPRQLAEDGNHADSHYCCPEVLDWCRSNGLDYIFGVAPTTTLRVHIETLEANMKARFEAAPKDGKLRRFKEFFDGAASWSRVEQIIARVEVGDEGADTRFIVTNPTSSGCSCTAGPTGSCGAGALQCPNVRCGASRNSTSCACG